MRRGYERCKDAGNPIPRISLQLVPCLEIWKERRETGRGLYSLFLGGKGEEVLGCLECWMERDGIEGR